MKTLICFVLFLGLISLFPHSPLVGQPDFAKVDSLKHALNSSQVAIDEKIETLNSICEYYKRLNNDSIAKYAQMGFDLTKGSEDLEIKIAHIEFIQRLGEAYILYPKALGFFEQAADQSELLIAEQNKNGSPEVLLELVDQKIRILSNIGVYYHYVPSYDQAIKYYLQSTEVAKEVLNQDKSNDEIIIRLAHTTANIGSVYGQIGEYQTAMDYSLQAVDIAKKGGKNELLPRFLRDKGTFFYYLNQVDSAISTYEVSINVAKSQNNSFEMYRTMNTLVSVLAGSNPREALVYLEEMLGYWSESDDHSQILTNYTMRAACYEKIGELDSALNYLELSVAYIKTNKMDPYLVAESYYQVGQTYQFMGEKTGRAGFYDQALKFQEAYYVLNDSIFTEEKAAKLREFEVKYETERKDKELLQKNAVLAKQTIQRNALLTGFGLLGIISLLVYRSQRQKAKLNEQLKETEETKNRWFVNVSHELKTPLTLVQGPVSQLMESDSLNEVDRTRLKLANRNLRNLQGLVGEILDLSKLEKGHLELEPTPTNLSEMVKSTVASFESLAKVNKVGFQEEVIDDFWMNLDSDKIRKVIENLISNALKFTHEGENVQVSLTQEKGNVQVTVEDTGEGISEEDLPHVFDRFYQSKEKGKSRQGGTGVGLSLAKEVAEMHKGTLTVSSTRGEGSVFVLSLPEKLNTTPVYVEEKAAHEMAETPLREKYLSRTKEKPHLLLVEDNADMRVYIEDIMKHEYHLTMARDGKDALETLKSSSFDLIISDVMMPRMDGLELVTKIKEHKDWSQLPIIMLTALNTDEDRIHALRIGIDDYLGKPFNPEELRVRAANLVGNRQQRMEEYDSNEHESFDNQLLRKLEEEVKKHLTDSILSVNYLAEKANMSERSLRRYLKKSTGLSPLEFIQEIKLQKALELLERQTYPTLKEVATAAGFDRSARLTVAFEKRFGKKPSDFLVK